MVIADDCLDAEIDSHPCTLMKSRSTAVAAAKTPAHRTYVHPVMVHRPVAKVAVGIMKHLNVLNFELKPSRRTS